MEDKWLGRLLDESHQYWLMDGRAVDDVDRALVLETCSTLREAHDNRHDYGGDTCIVDETDQELLYCILWETDPVK